MVVRMWRSLAVGLVTAVALVVGLVTLAGSAEATPSCQSRGTSIGGGGALSQNDCLRSSNGRYTLAMQADGNFVLYSNNTACWASAWEESGRHRAGDHAYVYVDNYGLDTETGVAVATPGRGILTTTWQHWTDHVHQPFESSAYNISLNNSGQFYIGYSLYKAC